MPSPSPKTSELRRATRRSLHLAVEGPHLSEQGAGALIQNLSTTGLLLETGADLALGENISIELPMVGSTVARIVWNSGNLFGCEFPEPISSAASSAAQLQSQWRVSEAAVRPEFSSTTETFDLRLRRLRKEKGLSAQRLANLVGVSGTSVWSWESGSARPRGSRLGALAEALGVSENELLIGTTPTSEAGKPTPPAIQSVGEENDAPPLGIHRFTRPVSHVARLPQLVAASKHQIADLAGTTPDKVKIIVEF